MTIGVLTASCWEIIADNLSEAGWSWGCISAMDFAGRTVWIADAHHGDGKPSVVRADEKVTAFLELEAEFRNHHGRLPENRSVQGCLCSKNKS